ncbi:hypothetical protein GCM10010428_38840 [Actinosynnema pretiosum subsp. pretiosum]
MSHAAEIEHLFDALLIAPVRRGAVLRAARIARVRLIGAFDEAVAGASVHDASAEEPPRAEARPENPVRGNGPREPGSTRPLPTRTTPDANHDRQ